MQPNIFKETETLEVCEGVTLNHPPVAYHRANRSFDRSNRKDFPINNEQIIRRAYELAEKVDIKGWVECLASPTGGF
jgi:hypothetical protein